jgi:hypothetical protein
MSTIIGICGAPSRVFPKQEGKDIKVMLGKPTVWANVTSLPTKSVWCHLFNIFFIPSRIGLFPQPPPPLLQNQKGFEAKCLRNSDMASELTQRKTTKMLFLRMDHDIK